jgi:uroporphyrinogen-III synthase
VIAGQLALVTRALPDAHRTTERLSARGVPSLITPMLEIIAVPHVLPPRQDFDALVLTSAAAVRTVDTTALAGCTALCVGEGTARAAAAAGLDVILDADGDARALAHAIQSRSTGAGRRLLHLSGRTIAQDMRALLGPQIELRRIVVYEARMVTALDQDLRAALMARRVAALTLHSRRAASAFAALIRQAELADHLTGAVAVAITARVAPPIADLCTIRVASEPTDRAVVDLVASVFGIGRAGPASNADS